MKYIGLSLLGIVAILGVMIGIGSQDHRTPLERIHDQCQVAYLDTYGQQACELERSDAYIQSHHY